MALAEIQNPSCIFCRVVRNEARADIVYRNEWVTAFRDIRPQAPTHILIVPNSHIESVNELQPEHGELLAQLLLIARQLAREEGVADSGYRLVMNIGSQGGQSVGHLHLHLLGGRRMTWPPG
jgi:histidine triad (HIT) family protein